MGRGIAVHFAYAGHDVTLVDLKARPADDFARLSAAATAEVRETLAMLAELGLGDAQHVDAIAARLRVVPARDAGVLAGIPVVFEGVPEIPDLKREALAQAAAHMAPDAILASTTSTIMVDDLSPAVPHPARFLNAHWLNPAYLVPLIEVSPGQHTDEGITARLMALLDSVGKVPVRCAPSPGFIIPRIQALAMNEAARMVEEGVASAEDIDKALKLGLNHPMGPFEMVDLVGLDVRYSILQHLHATLGETYRPANLLAQYVKAGRLGRKSGKGVYVYDEEGNRIG